MSQNLLAIGLSESVVIIQCTFPEDEETISEVQYEVLQEIHHDSRVQALSWSPETCLSLDPGRCLKFATGGADSNVRVFTTDLADREELQVFRGHTDYVNSLVFTGDDAASGGQLASGSDDKSVILWDTRSGQRLHTFTFRSPVMSVAWNDVSKLMAAEKCGVVHIFNSVTFSPILSLDCGGPGPLLSADWCVQNSLLVSCAVRGEWLVWDTSNPSLPVVKKSLNQDGLRFVRFSPFSDSVVAVTGLPYIVKVANAKNNFVPFSMDSGDPIGGIAWQFRLPYLAVAGDGKVSLCKIINQR